MRLNKYLAHVGIAARRKCDELIREGKVKINGEVVTDFSRQVTPEDIVHCRGTIIPQPPDRVVYLLHKPRGVISASSDSRGRRTVIDLFPEKERLFTVGRLDRDTTGVILVTNDGDLAFSLTHPRFQIERIYLAVTLVDIPVEKRKQLSKGLKLEDGSLARGQLQRLDKDGRNILWKVTLREGKYREVKRIFQALDARVEHLHRQSFAGISADALSPGKYRRLTGKELTRLLELNL